RGAPVRADVALAPASAVRGTVRDRSGAALRDAHVSLVDVEGNVVATTRTGRDGAYEFGGLAGEEYTLVASGYAPVAVPLHLTGAGRDGFDVALSHRRA
uniref:carboxypeptidase-like regulatory domain-containing protein n=1 Tax=Actinomadura roseirufa TaxID=2094049 RepID=UPI0010416C92